jgi:hypothetical protein
MAKEKEGPPLGGAPGYGGVSEGVTGGQGTSESGVTPEHGQAERSSGESTAGPAVGGEHSQASVRRVGRDEDKGSQGFGNE